MKRSLWCGLLASVLAFQVWADCAPQQSLEPARVARVTDGDTLRLVDGRRVRLIGLNAPELRPQAEPLAEDARQYLSGRLVDGRVWLHAERAPKDGHGRHLMHAFDAEGRSLVEGLLAEGLGFLALFPPALAYADCFVEAEQRARMTGRGVWKESAFGPLPADGRLRSGFVRLQGEVLRVDTSRQAIWLQLRGQAVLKVNRADWRGFEKDPLPDWVGRRLEITGWLVDRQQGRQALPRGFSRWMMVLRHPSAVRLLPDPRG